MRSLTTPTKVVLIGFACAVLLACAGYALTYRDEVRLDRAVAACEADDHGTAEERAARKELEIVPFCEPSFFYGQMSGAWTGAQKDVRDAIAARSANNLPGLLYFLAIVVAFGAALPWSWYFLLRRLREVREALTGR